MSRTRDSKGISKKLIQDVHRIINEKWDMGDVARPQGNIPTNPEDEFYRREAADMSLVYGATRRPVRNKKEFADALANKFNLERNQVLEEIRKLEQKLRPKEKYDFINVLLDELKKLSGRH